MSVQHGIKQHIAQYGLSVIGTTGFAYSIGRAQLGQPDIVVCSSYTKSNHMLINLVHEYLLKGGKFGITTELLEGKGGVNMPVCIRRIERNHELTSKYVVQAEHFYERNPEYALGSLDNVSYVQVLMPDRNGLLPTQDGYEHDRIPQTILTPITIN